MKKTTLFVCLSALLSLPALADECSDRAGALSEAACEVFAAIDVESREAGPGLDALSEAQDNEATTALRSLLEDEVLANSFRLVKMVNEEADALGLTLVGDYTVLSDDEARHFLHWPDAHWLVSTEQGSVRVDLSGMLAEVVASDTHVDLFFRLPEHVRLTDAAGSMNYASLNTEDFLLSARFDRELKEYVAYDLMLEDIELERTDLGTLFTLESFSAPSLSAFDDGGWVSEGLLSFANFAAEIAMPEEGEEAHGVFELEEGAWQFAMQGDDAESLRTLFRDYPAVIEDAACLVNAFNAFEELESERQRASILGDCEAQMARIMNYVLEIYRGGDMDMRMELSDMRVLAPNEAGEAAIDSLSWVLNSQWQQAEDDSAREQMDMALTLEELSLLIDEEASVQASIDRISMTGASVLNYGKDYWQQSVNDMIQAMTLPASVVGLQQYGARGLRSILRDLQAYERNDMRLRLEDIQVEGERTPLVSIEHIEFGLDQQNEDGMLAMALTHALKLDEDSNEFLAMMAPPGMMPQSLDLGLSLNQLPLAAISAEVDAMMAQMEEESAPPEVSASDEDGAATNTDELLEDLETFNAQLQGMDKLGQALLAKLPGLLREAGTELEILPSSIVLDEPRADLSGRVEYNPQAVYQAEGELNLSISEFDKIIAVVQAMNPQAAGGLTMFQSMSEREEVDGTPVDNYAASVTADGKLMLNGRDMSAMLQMLGGMR